MCLGTWDECNRGYGRESASSQRAQCYPWTEVLLLSIVVWCRIVVGRRASSQIDSSVPNWLYLNASAINWTRTSVKTLSPLLLLDTPIRRIRYNEPEPLKLRGELSYRPTTFLAQDHAATPRNTVAGELLLSYCHGVAIFI